MFSESQRFTKFAGNEFQAAKSLGVEYRKNLITI